MVCVLNDLHNNRHLTKVIGICLMVKCVILICFLPVRNYFNAIFFYYHSVEKKNYTGSYHLKGCRQKNDWVIQTFFIMFEEAVISETSFSLKTTTVTMSHNILRSLTCISLKPICNVSQESRHFHCEI